MADEKQIQEPITINIGNICDGAAVEAFEMKLRECLENICDLNTPATASRTITLKVKLKPREDRVQITSEFSCDVSLPSFEPKVSRIFIDAQAKAGAKAGATRRDGEAA